MNTMNTNRMLALPAYSCCGWGIIAVDEEYLAVNLRLLQIFQWEMLATQAWNTNNWRISAIYAQQSCARLASFTIRVLIFWKNASYACMEKRIMHKYLHKLGAVIADESCNCWWNVDWNRGLWTGIELHKHAAACIGVDILAAWT